MLNNTERNNLFATLAKLLNHFECSDSCSTHTRILTALSDGKPNK
jgi:hypothetical protein